MVSTLHIRLLGAFHAIQDGETLAGFRSVRVQELLAYLVLHAGVAHSRQHLAFLFWPASTETQARTNLRKVLYSLRQALPGAEEFLCIDSSTVEWLDDSNYTLDVAEINRLLQEAERDPLNADILKEAVDLYGGKLLPGSYEEWLLAWRQRVHRDIVSALQKLVTLLENRRDYAEGIDYAESLVAMDLLREASYLGLMRLYGLAGQRAEALRVYSDCVAMLHNELGVDPGPELMQAYARLTVPETPPDRRNYPQAHISDIPKLIGREREWETLRGIWEQAVRGAAQMAVISGEAGFGKTRLAEEALNWARHQGATVARTRSFASQGALAYAPVAELLRQEPINRRVAALDDLWLGEVARLLPELVEAGKVGALPRPITEPWQRQRFLQAMVRAVTVVDQPTLLLIDDLQWCDRETLLWLQYLLHEASNARLLVAGTVRNEEVDDRHPYTALQQELTQAGQFTEVPVPLLEWADTQALAAQVAGKELTVEQAGEVWQISSGNPLFVTETVRFWMDEATTGVASPRTLAAAEKDASDSRAMRLPPKVYNAIRSRLTHLSPPAREVVKLAATGGRSFSYPVLLTAGELNEIALIDTLEELLSRRIVVEHGDDYDFSHDRIRDVAYAEISHTRRRYLHSRVAAAIESVHADNLDDLSGELAYHHEQAGNLTRAIHYLRIAGERVSTQFVHEEAVAYFTRALALLPERELEQRIDLLLLREAALTLQTDMENRHADLLEMRRLADSLDGDPIKVNLYKAKVNIRWIEFVGYQGENQKAIRLGQDTIELAQTAGALDIETRAHFHVGRDLWALGRMEESRVELARALRMARGLGDDDTTARSLEYLSQAGWFTDEASSRVLEMLDQALAIQQQRGDLVAQADIHGKLGVTHRVCTEDLDAARRHFAESLRLCQLTGHLERRYIVEGNLGYVTALKGDYGEGERLLNRALVSAQEQGNTFVIGLSLISLGDVFGNRGDFQAAKQALERGTQILRQAGILHMLVTGYVYAILLHHYTGDQEAAETYAQESLSIIQPRNARQEGIACTYLGHVLAAQGRLVDAVEAYERGLTLHRRMKQPRRSLVALAGLARIAERQDDANRAMAYVEEILQDLDAIGSFVEEETFRVYHTCSQLLRKYQDPRAPDILSLAHQQLKKRAASLTDAEQQGLFWAMPGHRELARGISRR